MAGGAPSPAIERAAAGGLPQAEQQQQPPQRRRYRGVRLRKWGSWVAEVRFPNSRERLWLGSYATEEQAARAFDAALYCLRGPGAEFNFPGQVPEIPIAAELSREEIRAAAARFAGQGAPPITLRDEGSGGDVTAMEAAPGSAGEGTMTAESSSSTTTKTTSVGVFTGFECYITATAEAPGWWNEEEEEAAAAAVDSFDDIYSTSPLWNFNN